MWNSSGIFFAILYIGSIITIFGLLISICLDETRIANSKKKINKEYLQKNQTIKLYLVSLFFIVWIFAAIDTLERDKLHEIGISDNKCIELATEYNLNERALRDYLIFTSNNGKSLDEALDFLKGDD